VIDIYDVVKRPMVTESSMRLLEDSNTYVFNVHPKANKVQIRNAIERLFKVKVLGVNTARRKGKPRRRGRHVSHLPNWKKAYVKIHEGDTIELF